MDSQEMTLINIPWSGCLSIMPTHGIRECMLLQYFYEGLLQMEREFLDSTVGGSFLDKSNVVANDLLEKKAMNNQQFGTSASSTRLVELKFVESVRRGTLLISVLKLLLVEGMRKSMPLVIKETTSSTTQCSTSQRGEYSNYDEMLKSLAVGQSQLNTVTQTLVVGQQANSEDIVELKTHMGQVIDFMGRFSEQGKLPSGVIPNPNNEQAQAIMTRSGLELKERPSVARKTQTAHVLEEGDKMTMMNDLEKDPVTSNSMFSKSKKDKADEEVLEVFRNVLVNLLLLECIKQIPKYAKFLKEICTSKRQIREENVVKMNETAPKLDLKELPDHLKYVYLGNDDTLLVIVSSTLSKQQEARLIDVL
ncbi:uncharacterized protein LOC126786952 [Argentina anserina]|uniref:uncharacterized protein LOC126786952 n=1 Tax=Argentina anserina TaxID=57926 RepID=UPI0021768F60|nr:uncharacterized protein LOC126786952 [Potentilla anserina]